jgi:conjugal transfer ATP-binding protein TraC
MLKGSSDPLDAMFRIQSFDQATKTFFGSFPSEDTVHLGGMWLGPPMTGLDESTIISLQSMLSGMFAEGSIIQIGLLASPDIQGAVANYVEKKKVAHHPLLTELTNRHADMILSGIQTPLIKSSGVMLSNKRLIVTLKCKYDKPLATNLINFQEQAGKIDSNLKSNGMILDRADVTSYLLVNRLLTHIYDLPDSRYNDAVELNEQIFYAGDEVVVKKNHLEFNTGATEDKNFVMGALTPKLFPKEFSLGLMNYVIGDPRGMDRQIKNPYLLILSIYYPNQMEKKASIEKRSAWINHQLFGGGTSGILKTLSLKKEGFDVLTNEMERHSAILVEVTFNLWLYARTEKELKETSEDVRVYWASLGFNMQHDKLILDALFSASLPLNSTYKSTSTLNRTHTMTSSQATQFMPLLSEWRGSPDPSLLLTTRRGEIGGFDLYNSSSNYNALLVAQSGSGKSFLTQAIIKDYLAEGAKVWVIDSGRSYQKLAASVSGQFIEFAPGSKICLNPFTSYLPERGGRNKVLEEEMDILSSLIERMTAQRDPLGDLEVEMLRKAIRSAFGDKGGHTTVKDISAFLSNLDGSLPKELALRMESFANGQYAKYFNGHANVNMAADLVVLELGDLKNQQQLQQVVLLQLVAQITNEMYLTSGRKKLLIIDEGWAMLDDEVMGRAMDAAYRQARKHDGAIMTVTQGINDLYNSKAGPSMISNAAWMIILEQKSEAIDEVYKSGRLTLDAYSLQMLKTVKTVPNAFSEMMIIGNGNCGIFRLTVDRFTQALFSTKGLERTQVLKDIENGMNVVESIQRLMIGPDSYERLQSLKDLMVETIESGLSRSEVKLMITAAVEEVAKEDAAERASSYDEDM